MYMYYYIAFPCDNHVIIYSVYVHFEPFKKRFLIASLLFKTGIDTSILIDISKINSNSTS